MIITNLKFHITTAECTKTVRAVGDARQSTIESHVITERSLMRFVCVGVFFARWVVVLAIHCVSKNVLSNFCNNFIKC